MKKIISLLLILILFTGCSIQKIEDTSFDSIIKSILYQEIDLANSNFEGYKFYLPRGTKVYDKKDSNLEIKDQDNTYYLYVDCVSYFSINSGLSLMLNLHPKCDIIYKR